MVRFLPAVLEKGEPVEIFAKQFGPSSVDSRITGWSELTPLHVRTSRDEFVEAVAKGLDEAGIEIPFPYLTLTFTESAPDITDAVSGRVAGT